MQDGCHSSPRCCAQTLGQNVSQHILIQAPFFSWRMTLKVFHVGAKACVTDCKLFQHLKARITASNTIIGWILITSLFGWSSGLCWLAHRVLQQGFIRSSWYNGKHPLNEVTATPWHEVSGGTGLHNTDSHTLWHLQPSFTACKGSKCCGEICTSHTECFLNFTHKPRVNIFIFLLLRLS